MLACLSQIRFIYSIFFVYFVFQIPYCLLRGFSLRSSTCWYIVLVKWSPHFKKETTSLSWKLPFTGFALFLQLCLSYFKWNEIDVHVHFVIYTSEYNRWLGEILKWNMFKDNKYHLSFTSNQIIMGSGSEWTVMCTNTSCNMEQHQSRAFFCSYKSCLNLTWIHILFILQSFFFLHFPLVDIKTQCFQEKAKLIAATGSWNHLSKLQLCLVTVV